MNPQSKKQFEQLLMPALASRKGKTGTMSVPIFLPGLNQKYDADDWHWPTAHITPKDKDRCPGSDQEQPNFSSRFTGPLAQRQRLLASLRLRPETVRDFRRLGVHWSPARTIELRRWSSDTQTIILTQYRQSVCRHSRATRRHLMSEAEK